MSWSAYDRFVPGDGDDNPCPHGGRHIEPEDCPANAYYQRPWWDLSNWWLVTGMVVAIILPVCITLAFYNPHHGWRAWLLAFVFGTWAWFGMRIGHRLIERDIEIKGDQQELLRKAGIRC